MYSCLKKKIFISTIKLTCYWTLIPFLMWKDENNMINHWMQNIVPPNDTWAMGRCAYLQRPFPYLGICKGFSIFSITSLVYNVLSTLSFPSNKLWNRMTFKTKRKNLMEVLALVLHGTFCLWYWRIHIQSVSNNQHITNTLKVLQVLVWGPLRAWICEK
jgi:hypothetical protein